MSSLEVPNRFFKDWIHEHYTAHIKEAVSQFMGKPCQLHFQIKSDRGSEKDLTVIPPQRKEPEQASVL